MPGLLRGVGRVAIAAGTATAVSNRVSRRQANKWADQGDPNYGGQPQPEQPPQYQEPPPPAAPAVDPIAQLKDLADLHSQGVLTDEEFAVQKSKILGQT